MILIITHKEDYTADFVINKLNQRGIPYFRFNCEDCLNDTISLRLSEKNFMSINGTQKFHSVWYRRTQLPQLTGYAPEEKIYILNEIDNFMSNLFGIIDAKWLSEPLQVLRAENKFLQLLLAKSIGFNVPRTLISTDKKEVKEFMQSAQKCIIKPISSGRVPNTKSHAKLIFTNIIPEDMIAHLEEYETTPAIYQDYIEKCYEIRVTIVGNKVFSACVNSQQDQESSVDWRKMKLKFERYDLPNDVSDKCVSLLKLLSISFGAFDLIKSKTGEYYFLEVNPNGQWVWIEKDTGLNISDEIINYLL
jgi:glutathione synthase/RimK-type ligase-like ATP-grasp enzyme